MTPKKESVYIIIVPLIRVMIGRINDYTISNIIIVPLIRVMIGRMNDYTISNLVHITPIGITYYNKK